MELKKVDNKIVIEIPFFQKRMNPYDDEGDYGLYPTLTGLIIRNKNGLDEIGFANTIDMDYKGKADQVGSWIVMLDDEKQLEKLCDEWHLNLEVMDFRKQIPQ